MGQPLTASWLLTRVTPDLVEGLEASIMWYTEGKGDEDLNVHYFQRWNDSQLRELDLSRRHQLHCPLPVTPLSYEGTLLRIRWCVRLRLFCSAGLDAVAQVPFQLLSDLTRPVAGYPAAGDQENLPEDADEDAGMLAIGAQH